MALPNINDDLCTGCGLCVDECAPQALEMKNDLARLAKPDECTSCGSCKDNCPSEAITLI